MSFNVGCHQGYGSYLGGIEVYIGELIPLNLSGFRIAITDENLTNKV